MLPLLLIALLVSLGHFSLWVYLHNCVNAFSLPRWLQKPINVLTLAISVVGPLLILAWTVNRGITQGWAITPSDGASGTNASLDPASRLAMAYGVACLAISLSVVPWFIIRHHLTRLPAAVTATTKIVIDVQRQSGQTLSASGWRGWLVRMPGNESLQLEINEKQFRIPQLNTRLAGLSITHLSDLHYTGKIQREYFEEVVRRANALESDLIAITGDLLDKSALVAWLPETLGRLKAPLGVYCVLGNHDRRINTPPLLAMLEKLGIQAIGGKRVALEHGGARLFLTGNELPWFKPTETGPLLPDRANEPLRILLSHSPDQFRWAQQHRFQLMLAGHTHGGQICFPGIGPIVSPSFYGVRYAAGSFDLSPTLLHVSRGISGKTPLRYGCPPELTKLVLMPR